MSLPLFSSFFSALNVFADSSATSAHKPGDDSVVRAVQVRVLLEAARECICRCEVSVLLTSAPFFIRLRQEVRLDLEKALRSDAHQLASHLLSDALTRHTWSIQQQLAVIDNAECPAASRGSEACIHAAFQNSMLQHMDSCFGFNLGSKPAPSISLRSLSVGSVSSETAVHISRAFITGYIMVSLCCASSMSNLSPGIQRALLDLNQLLLQWNHLTPCCRTRSSRVGARCRVGTGSSRILRQIPTMKILLSMFTTRCRFRPQTKCCCCNR